MAAASAAADVDARAFFADSGAGSFVATMNGARRLQLGKRRSQHFALRWPPRFLFFFFCSSNVGGAFVLSVFGKKTGVCFFVKTR